MLRSLFIGLSESKGLRNFAEKSPLGLAIFAALRRWHTPA